jgi:hypothetical protein
MGRESSNEDLLHRDQEDIEMDKAFVLAQEEERLQQRERRRKIKEMVKSMATEQESGNDWPGKFGSNYSFSFSSVHDLL